MGLLTAPPPTQQTTPTHHVHVVGAFCEASDTKPEREEQFRLDEDQKIRIPFQLQPVCFCVPFSSAADVAAPSAASTSCVHAKESAGDLGKMSCKNIFGRI